jgi:hypothetical protein
VFRRVFCERPEADVLNRRIVTTSALALTSVVALPLLTACAPTQITQWEMNEAPGATVMRDTSGSNINGHIGSEVRVGTVEQGRTGYGESYVVNGNGGSVHPGKLLVVPNDNRLNPGTSNYVIGATFRFDVSGTNVAQKGQAETPGGYVKLETHEGHVSCVFQGSASVSAVVSPGTYQGNLFHSYRCERNAAFGVRLSVDGAVVGTNPKQPGNISNTWPFVIGGKYMCNQTTVQCDYFSGMIDRVAVSH